jgi:hypothetical protein
VELAYYEWTDSLLGAFQRERQLKGWSRKKKEALIAGRSDLLPSLSSRRSVNAKASFVSPASSFEARPNKGPGTSG